LNQREKGDVVLKYDMRRPAARLAASAQFEHLTLFVSENENIKKKFEKYLKLKSKL
jgi:hypothetical protein